MTRFLLLFSLAAGLFAQTQVTRNVTLTWEDTKNPAATTYTVERFAGNCSESGSFASIASGVTAKTFQDTVPLGRYCYRVKAVFSGLESEPSNTAGASAGPFSPLNLQITLTVVIN